MRRFALIVLAAVVVAAGAVGAVALASGSNPNFTFSSDEAGVSFQCSVDGGAFAACTSPQSYTGLASGAHTVDMRAAFTVPSTPPSAAFSVSDSPTTGTPTTFTATGSDDCPCSYSWSDDGGTTQPTPPQWPLGTGNPLSFTFQGAGIKYVRLIVTGQDGQTATVEHDVNVVAPGGGTTTTTSSSTTTTSSTTTAPPPPSGCFGNPASCGLPSPTTTGVPNCAALPSSGSITTSSSGQTISNLNVTGTIQVTKPNVTINNVCVTNNGGAVLGSNAVKVTSTGTLIENSTLAGANDSKKSVEQAVTNFGGGTVTMTNDYVYNCGECLNTGSWTVSNSYILNNGMYNTNDHLEAVYTSDATVSITHSVLLTPPGWNGAGSPNGGQAGVLFGDTHGGSGGACDNHWSITNNLIAGDGVLIYECGNASGAGSSSMTFTGNRVARCLGATHNDSQGYSECVSVPVQTGADTGRGGDGHGFYPDGGLKDIEFNTYCSQGWSGNVWDDNGAAVACG